MRGFVFYDGPSAIDGEPIVGIAILHSETRKTGNMVQTFILRADQSPLEAIATGDDASICGDCVHRGDRATGRARTCYVEVGRSVVSVFGAWIRGAYPLVSPGDGARLLAGRKVRLGAYGDPAAIPGEHWRALIALAAELRPYVMASVDSAAELVQARAASWRTFRVRTASEPLAAREIACPASPEGGARRQCADCLACDGAADSPGRASVAIIVHGAMAARFASA